MVWLVQSCIIEAMGNCEAPRLQKVYTLYGLLLSRESAAQGFIKFPEALFEGYMKKANQEVEIKLRVPDIREFGLRLKRLKARVVVPRTYESNTLYDTPSRNLTRHGQLVRIRMEQQSPR